MRKTPITLSRDNEEETKNILGPVSVRRIMGNQMRKIYRVPHLLDSDPTPQAEYWSKSQVQEKKQQTVDERYKYLCNLNNALTTAYKMDLCENPPGFATSAELTRYSLSVPVLTTTGHTT